MFQFLQQVWDKTLRALDGAFQNPLEVDLMDHELDNNEEMSALWG